LPVVVFCRCVNAIPDRSVYFLGHRHGFQRYASEEDRNQMVPWGV